jgi:hypothetical protein
MASTELIEKTWEEVGWRVRPLRRQVFCRTETRPWKHKGLVWLPPNQTMIFSKDTSKLDVEIFARVLSVGPKVRSIKVGDLIWFSRLYFAWWKRLYDLNYVGYLDEMNVFGLSEEDEVELDIPHASSENQRERTAVV